MENELIINDKKSLATFVGEKGIGDLLEPLVKEIHLFDSFVAKTTSLEHSEVLDSIKVGDKLTLLRENSKFDDNAIVISTEGKQKIGYVPESDNVVFARLMDAGKLLIARVHKVTNKGTFKQISIGIYLVDF